MENTVTLQLTNFQLEFLAGFFLGCSYHSDRDQRKTAIENIGQLYRLLTPEQKQSFAIEQEKVENFLNSEDLKNEVTELMAAAIEKYNQGK